MATAPRIRPTSPDSSELGIKYFTPKSPREETLAAEPVKKTMQSVKTPSFSNLSEREQVRMLWGSRRKSRKVSRKQRRKTLKRRAK